jgi:hypothetical protein
MAELRPEGLGAEGGKDEDVSDLMELYRTAKKRFDVEDDFKTRAREAVTRLQSGVCGCGCGCGCGWEGRLSEVGEERGGGFVSRGWSGVVRDRAGMPDGGLSVLSGPLTSLQDPHSPPPPPPPPSPSSPLLPACARACMQATRPA